MGVIDSKLIGHRLELRAQHRSSGEREDDVVSDWVYAICLLRIREQNIGYGEKPL